MDDLLTPVTVTKKKAIQTLRVTPTRSNAVQATTSPQDALATLRAQPNILVLEEVLAWLNQDRPDFSIADPSPVSAQIIYTLVNSTIADYWQTLVQSRPKDVAIFLRILRTVSGVGALLARLKLLIDRQEQNKKSNDVEATYHDLEDAISVLEKVLTGDQTSERIYESLQHSVRNDTKRLLAWREYVSQIAAGKVLSTVSQAQLSLKRTPKQNHSSHSSWLADGANYASWLGRNIATMICSVVEGAESDIHIAAARLAGKAMSLGHRNQLVTEIVSTVLVRGDLSSLSQWISKLQSSEQRQFLVAALSHVIPQLMRSVSSDNPPFVASPQISGAASLLQNLVSNSTTLNDALSSWLLKCSAAGTQTAVAMIRAVVAVLSLNEDNLQILTEKLMADFGDSLYIRHTPILIQECLTKTLLICSGYVHRRQAMALFMLARQSTHMSAISNRLAASSPRARFLGMAVGQLVSEIVDKSGAIMEFSFDDSDKNDLEMLRHFVKIEDSIGEVQDLVVKPPAPLLEGNAKAERRSQPISKPAVEMQARNQLSGPRVVEVLEGSDGDEDLVPYGKPDSDHEDEDDDPSMTKRDKPTAPVYIRDLIANLRDTENYDQHSIALQTAPVLIRRKAGFGKEVLDHIDDLASLFIGLTDHFELDEEFHDLRQQALIAILLAQPAAMGQFYARAYFEGEYSISQRLAVLTAVGLGARELAGFDDFEQDQKIKEASKAFPSKQLPPHLHKLYAEESQPVASLSRRLEQMMIQPMALQAADKATGPNILKVRTFSSRMEVEKKRKKPIANELAKVVAQNFLFPLTGRWWSHIQAYGPSTMQSTPHLLPTYLRTLSLLLHSSGPSTLSLPSMTSEFWDLLLSLRTVAIGDITIMEAVLFSFLTLLDVNEDHRRIAQEHPKELLETQIWVKGVWEGMGKGSDGSQDERVSMLAASILVRSQEIVEKHQRMLMGDMMAMDR